MGQLNYINTFTWSDGHQFVLFLVDKGVQGQYFVMEDCLTNRMWFSVVCTLIDNDIRHYSGQNVWTQEAQPSESTTNFDHCDDEYRCR